MAFDGIVTAALAGELNKLLKGGKIEKIYQPLAEEIVIHIRSLGKKYKLLLSVNSSNPRICLVNDREANPENPPSFCMLLRKHLMNSRVINIEQYSSERIIEFTFDSVDEMGFSVNKKLILEIMGKHSNLVLTRMPDNKILDSIKRISIDVNRFRQTLPGLTYVYPPTHDKVPFNDITEDDFIKAVGAAAGTGENDLMDAARMFLSPSPKSITSSVQGISSLVAEELCGGEATAPEAYRRLTAIIGAVSSRDLDSLTSRGTSDQEADETGSAPAPKALGGASEYTFSPAVYFNEQGEIADFHTVDLKILLDYPKSREFATINEAVDFFYSGRSTSNRITQKAHSLLRSVRAKYDKLLLKKQRLSEELLKAQNSDEMRLRGELLTANMHLIKQGADRIKVINYYDGSELEIQLDPLLSPSANAQKYYKKYSKSKTAVEEKTTQLEETQKEIDYFESVLMNIENASDADDIDEIRLELTENGYIRRRKQSGRKQKAKIRPHEYTTSDGLKVLVGRNNIENDVLTLKTAGSRDLWLHTKDIPGSHVILFTEGLEDIPADSIREAAAIAAFHSKGRMSSNVPVDYVNVKYVKKPAGAKPGKVIFTNNRTIWIDPALPGAGDEEQK